MHQNFADWYQPVTFGHDRPTIDLRWQGVEAVINNIDFTMAVELIRLIFDRPLLSTDFMKTLREFFKENDSTFQMEGNDHELKVLAGSILAVLCLDQSNSMGDVATAILTASACKTRNPSVEIDLIGMAEDRIRIDGIDVRKRPEIRNLKKTLPLETFDEAFLPLEETPDLVTAIEVLKKFGGFAKTQMESVQRTNNEISLLQKLLKIQDEELQILWWMVSETSWMWDIAFRDIDKEAFPVLISKEVANLTEEFSEIPSLRAIFSHLGISESTDLTMQDSINACSIEQLKKMESDKIICPSISPLHFAISRAIETEKDAAWSTTWSKVTGISGEVNVSPLELALQFYRESKLLSRHNY